jgi:hypothetical protein
MKPRRWQDWVNVLLGVWLVASPWALSFTDNAVASRTSWVLGAAIVVFAGIAAYMPKAWEEAVSALLGLCTLLSPFVLGFSEHAAATANAVIVGILVGALGVWAMARDTDFQKWWNERQGHTRA